MRRAAAALIIVLALAGCRHAPQPAVQPKTTSARRAPPAAPKAVELDEPALQARAEGLAAWDNSVRVILSGERLRLQNCYDEELRRVEALAVSGAFTSGEAVPNLAGKLALVVPIESSGRVTSPRLEDDTLENWNVRECLLARARTLRFAPPPTGELVEVEVPFHFALMGPADR